MQQYNNTEIYTTPYGSVMIKQKDEPVRELSETGEENRSFITEFIDYLSTFYVKAYKVLCMIYSAKEPNRYNYEYWIVSRFCRCNMGEYDTYKPDIDENGRMQFEEVKCPLRGECPHEGIICKPEFTTSLSHRETEILRLIVSHRETENIAEILHLSPHTINNHRRNIHQKTETRTIAELVDFWKTHNLK